MIKNLSKADDDELWHWWQYHATEAGKIKRELDRRQNAPRLRVIKNRCNKPDPNINHPG